MFVAAGGNFAEKHVVGAILVGQIGDIVPGRGDRNQLHIVDFLLVLLLAAAFPPKDCFF